MMLIGLIHIYCGDGKGKTTAAIGLAVRCSGGGGRVLFVSFLKDNKSGERNALKNTENIELIENPENVPFYKFMNEKEKKCYNKYCADVLSDVSEKASKGIYNMLVLDEIIPAMNNGIIPENYVLDIIKERPDDLEIILTGRYPKENIMDSADYITEMKKIKHPYDKGITARKYIEM